MIYHFEHIHKNNNRKSSWDFMHDFFISHGDMVLLEKSVSISLNSSIEQIEKLKLAQWYLNNFEQKKVLSQFVGFINAIFKAYYEYK